jgi:urate oxidase
MDDPIHHRYGVSGVRVLKVARRSDRHDVRDVTVSVTLEGHPGASLSGGENRSLLSPETLRNAIQALALNTPPEVGEEQIEQFGMRLADYFLDGNPSLTQASIELREAPWSRLPVAGKPHPQAFLRGAGEERTAQVTASREGVHFDVGFDNAFVLKTAPARFTGYLQDPFSSPAEGGDALLAGMLTASWRYLSAEVPFATVWHGARQALLETFAAHESRSPQHLLHALCQTALSSYNEIAGIYVAFRRRAWPLADLSRFGLENRNELFLPAEAPESLTEVRLIRSAP